MMIASSYSLRGTVVEAGCRAELLPEVAHLRTAQQHVERPVGAAARSIEQVLHHRPLRGRHLVVGERFEAVAAQLDRARVATLRWRSLIGDRAGDGENDCAADQETRHRMHPFVRLRTL
jgi:hypothetical protein